MRKMLLENVRRFLWYVLWCIVCVVVLVLGLFAVGARWKSSQVVQVQPIKAIPVIIDFTELPKPENGELSIEAEGSLLWTKDGTRIVFWKPDNTISIGKAVRRFDCSGGGTVFIMTGIDTRFIYYDCATGRIAASRLAYHAQVVNFDASTYIANDAWKLVAKGSSLRTPSNWFIWNEDDESTLTIRTPLGELYKVTEDQVLLMEDDGRSLISAKGDAGLGYMFSLGFGSQLRLVVIRVNNEWIVAENNN